MDNNDGNGSDEAPEEFTFQAGNEELQKLKNIQTKEIANVKQHLKERRRLNHEKNKVQKTEKRKRLEELESKKLPEELLNLIKDSAEDITKKKLSKNKNNRRKSKKKKLMKEEYITSINDSVIVEVQPLETPKDKDILRSDAENFLKSRLYENKDIKRMPSRDLRIMKEKRKHGKIQ